MGEAEKADIPDLCAQAIYAYAIRPVLYARGPQDFQVGRLWRRLASDRVEVRVYANPIFQDYVSLVCAWWDGVGPRPTQNYAFEVPGHFEVRSGG